MKSGNAIFFLAFLAWTVLVAHVRPNVGDGGHDAVMYVRAAECFRDAGLACHYDREPFYPAFLALLGAFAPSAESLAPAAQNILFLSALFFLVHSVFPARGRRRNLFFSLGVALVPTFLIPLNGAIYTESISASLVMVLLASAVRFLRSELLQVRVAQLAVCFVCAVLLNLTKGSFSLIHYLFAVLLFVGAIFVRDRAKSLVALGALLILAGQASGRAWAYHQGAQIYGRGGAVLFGRTEYANRFDFSRDTLLYLVNGLSETACHKIYESRCASVRFASENILGNSRFEAGVPDTVLYREGVENIFRQPVRQGLFIPMEWSKFVLHHTTTGFAWLELPVLGAITQSALFVLALKLGNVLLYFIFFLRLMKLSRSRSRSRSRSGQSGAEVWPYYLLLAYLAAYLSVYGFVTTVVRMIYPVAPLLFLFALPEDFRALKGKLRLAG